MDSDSLDKDACAAWLVNKFGLKRFLSVVAVQKVLPASLTTQQHLAYISQFSGVPVKDVEYVLSITEKACPSVGDCVLPHATRPFTIIVR